MKINHLLIALLLCAVLKGQDVKWALNTHVPAVSKGLVTDRSGNVYNYGSMIRPGILQHGNQSSDLTGSYLYKYSSDGAELLKMRWKQSFHIQKMVYDGARYFYFTGTFFGNVALDGKSYSSRGNADGCVGCIDENGKVVWMSVFGGDQDDAGNGIALSFDKSRIAVTGGLSEDLYVNGELFSSGDQKRMLVAEFDLEGQLLSHQLYNFVSDRNEDNMGLEICTAKDGYLMLGHQEGRFWTDDSSSVPDYGTYVYKLNQQLAVTESKFIINGGCYYGFSCAGLSANPDGEAYIPSFCSSKYGGDGRLQRLSSLNAAPGWTLSNQDGSYSDTHCSAGNLYVTGTEGVNGCPCESFDPGYEVLKSYNSNNDLRWMIKAYDVNFNQVTRSESGVIFVAGHFRNESVNIGGITLLKDQVQNYADLTTFVFAVTDLSTALPDLISEGSDLIVFPNPSNGLVKWNFSQEKPAGTVNIRVINLAGQVQLEETKQINSGKMEGAVDMRGREKGIYFIEIMAGDTRHLRRIVFQ